jgi:TANFOR domain-containing protein
MYTESKKQNKNKLGIKRNAAIALLLVAGVFVWFSNAANAQPTPVKANVVVMPPYTPSLYDYINTPNKVVITLTHSLLDYPDIELYLKGTIRSEGGILVTTEPGYKPSVPITLERGKTIKLNNDNIQDAFNIRHTVIEGTNLVELLNGAGLPEDYYQICVQAFDFYTDQPLSGEQPIGCSNIFNITSLDVPQFIVPQCGDPIAQSVIQQININWTIPPGTIPGSRYLFEMVEIPDHSTLNPKEAFETSAYPPFYTEETSLNTLILTIQKVILTQGYTYAFRVKAFDPSKKMNYKNGGYSEVCWFKYGAQPSSQALWDNKQIQFVAPKHCHPDSMLLAAPPDGLYIGWRVLPFDPQNYKDPLENLPGHQFRVNFYGAKNAQQTIYTATTDRTFLQADPSVENLPLVSGKSYWVEVQVENAITKEVINTSERCAFRYVYSSMSGAGLVSRTVTGTLQYKFEKQGVATYPVANSEIRLKCVYLLNDKNSAKQFEIPESEVAAGLGSLATFPLGLTATPVASTLTASNGNFTFHFSWPENAPLGEIAANFSYNSKYFGSLSGKLTRAMRVEIVNPYYAQPQNAVMDNQTPHDMGELQTFVYSYELKASLTKGYKNNSKVKEELGGKNVYIFRKQKLPGIPINEGDRMGSMAMLVLFQPN